MGGAIIIVEPTHTIAEAGRGISSKVYTQPICIPLLLTSEAVLYTAAIAAIRFYPNYEKPYTFLFK